MENKINDYLDYLKSDYKKWGDNVHISSSMYIEYCDGVSVKYGSKYAKVSNKGSTHSFVVLKDNGKFKKGDILKAASFSAPATNKSRGNVLTDEYGVISWAGA
jgi:hypothetical protein